MGNKINYQGGLCDPERGYVYIQNYTPSLAGYEKGAVEECSVGDDEIPQQNLTALAEITALSVTNPPILLFAVAGCGYEGGRNPDAWRTPPANDMGARDTSRNDAGGLMDGSDGSNAKVQLFPTRIISVDDSGMPMTGDSRVCAVSSTNSVDSTEKPVVAFLQGINVYVWHQAGENNWFTPGRVDRIGSTLATGLQIAISNDGRFVAYAVSMDGHIQIVRTDRLDGSTEVVSSAPDATPGNGDTPLLGMNAIGDQFVMETSAPNLGNPPTYISSTVIKEMNSGAPIRIESGTRGPVALSGNGNLVSFNLSGELKLFNRTLGRYVNDVRGTNPLFNGAGTLFSYADADQQVKIFHVGSATDLPETISVRPDGITPGNGQSFFSSLSDEVTGTTWIGFDSMATDLVEDDAIDGDFDVFLRNKTEGSPSVTRKITDGTGGGALPRLTPDGHYMAFQCKGVAAGDPGLFDQICLVGLDFYLR